MGCCFTCLKVRHSKTQLNSIKAKNTSSPILGGQSNRSERGGDVIRPDINKIDRGGSQLRVIYAKKVVGDDPENGQARVVAKNRPSFRGMFQNLGQSSNTHRSECSDIQESSERRFKKNAIESDVKTIAESSDVEISKKDYIEINELHYLSSIKNEIKPKPIVNSAYMDMLRSSGILNKSSRDQLNGTLLAHYRVQVERLGGVLCNQKKIQAQLHQEIRQSDTKNYPANLELPKYQENKAPQQNFLSSHSPQFSKSPLIPISRKTTLGIQPFGLDVTAHYLQTQYFKSVKNMRKRNSTTPNIQQTGNKTSIPSIEQIDTPQANVSSTSTLQTAKHSQNSPEVCPSQKSLDNLDNLIPGKQVRHSQTPQFKHICSSVKSMHISKRYVFNRIDAANVIREQDSKDEAESVENDMSLISFKRKQVNDASIRFSELKKRNKTELPLNNKSSNKETIFSEVNNNPLVFFEGQPNGAEMPAHNQIQEMDNPEDESKSSSNYLGDRLFELQDGSEDNS